MMTSADTLSAIRQLARDETGQDDDLTCLHVAAALLADVLPTLESEQRTGFHRNGRAHTAKVRG